MRVIHTVIHTYLSGAPPPLGRHAAPAAAPRGGHRAGRQDSSKGGAVETGCSDVYDVIY